MEKVVRAFIVAAPKVPGINGVSEKTTRTIPLKRLNLSEM
jgi:hypothetical protein